MFVRHLVRPMCVMNKVRKSNKVKIKYSKSNKIRYFVAPRGPATADVGAMVFDLSSDLTDVINRALIGHFDSAHDWCRSVNRLGRGSVKVGKATLHRSIMRACYISHSASCHKIVINIDMVL